MPESDEQRIAALALQSGMEQFAAALVQLAASLGDYYKRLVQEGFSEDQAFLLVREAQNGLFMSVKK